MSNDEGAVPAAPTEQEALEIAALIFNFAQRISSGDVDATLDDMAKWFDKPDAEAALRMHYLAAVATVLATGLVRQRFPVPLQPDELWALELTPGSTPCDPHAWAMAQVLVRHLNDDQAAGQDLIEAHLTVHGMDGLFRLGCQGVKLVAALLADRGE